MSRIEKEARCVSVATLDVRFTRFLTPEAQLAGNAPAFCADRAQLIALYRAMTRTRVFDAKAIALQRTGRMGTFASSLGQEAVSVGVGSAMRPEDVLLPSFREQGAQLWRGVRPVEIFGFWGGDERGSAFVATREDFPNCLPVGSHAPQAAGVALAFKLRREPRVAVCVFGDGATSKGDVYEAMNLAGAWRLPVLFVITNNQWAISLSRTTQTAARTLAQKAVAAGFDGEQVDGNDVIAVRAVVEAALDKARQGGGPSCIEALTYRMADHTTADDSTRYRDKALVTAHASEDPLMRLGALLRARFTFTDAEHEAVLAECTLEVNRAAQEYLEQTREPATAMFDTLYAELPEVLRAQRTEAEKGDRHG
jgi:pyruvate dehydrogenase E1 component alpha subunit